MQRDKCAALLPETHVAGPVLAARAADHMGAADPIWLLRKICIILTPACHLTVSVFHSFPYKLSFVSRGMPLQIWLCTMPYCKYCSLHFLHDRNHTSLGGKKLASHAHLTFYWKYKPYNDSWTDPCVMITFLCYIYTTAPIKLGGIWYNTQEILPLALSMPSRGIARPNPMPGTNCPAIKNGHAIPPSDFLPPASKHRCPHSSTTYGTRIHTAKKVH